MISRIKGYIIEGAILTELLELIIALIVLKIVSLLEVVVVTLIKRYLK